MIVQLFDGRYTSNVPAYLATKANYGKTPITFLIVSGHGEYGRDGVFLTKRNYFTTDDILMHSKRPTFQKAKNSRGPARCWFCRKSTVRFVTCHSATTARNMATRILRKGSTAYGTRHYIEINFDDFALGWKLQYYNKTKKGYILVGESPINQPENADTWVAFEGKA